MIGKIISHYKIIAKLGKGGMGVVYKAEDTKLKRAVAIKFLRSHLTKNKELRDRSKKKETQLNYDMIKFAEIMKKPGTFYDHVTTYDIIEVSELAFEIKITECLWAKVFREANALSIGYLYKCYPDNFIIKYFNPKLKEQYDNYMKTLREFKVITFYCFRTLTKKKKIELKNRKKEVLKTIEFAEGSPEEKWRIFKVDEIPLNNRECCKCCSRIDYRTSYN